MERIRLQLPENQKITSDFILHHTRKVCKTVLRTQWFSELCSMALTVFHTNKTLKELSLRGCSQGCTVTPRFAHSGTCPACSFTSSTSERMNKEKEVTVDACVSQRGGSVGRDSSVSPALSPRIYKMEGKNQMLKVVL